MDTPLILVNGSKGKKSTIKYFSYLAGKFFKYNTLYYNFDNETETLKELIINDSIYINIEEHRKDVSYKNLINEYIASNNTLSELSLIAYVIIRYKIDIIITTPNLLSSYFNHILSGLTTIENHESQNIDYSVDLYINSSFIKEQVPLITCSHIKPMTCRIINVCEKFSIPLILANFYHLKYINYDTKLNTRYSYLNVCIALNLIEYLNKFYNIKTREVEQFSYLKYKTSTYNHKKVYVGSYPSSLPSLKGIIFDNTYAHIIQKNNVKFFIDSGGSYKSTNVICDWFSVNKSMNIKDISICIFSCDTHIDLVKTLLPLTTINFETLYLIDYNYKGRDFDNIIQNFENTIDVISDNNSPWIETMYNAFNLFYNDEKYEFGRKRSALPLNEYMGFDEIKTELDEDIDIIKLPKTPNLIIDDIDSILSWIFQMSNSNSNLNYNVLITGSKRIAEDVSNIIELL